MSLRRKNDKGAFCPARMHASDIYIYKKLQELGLASEREGGRGAEWCIIVSLDKKTIMWGHGLCVIGAICCRV